MLGIEYLEAPETLTDEQNDILYDRMIFQLKLKIQDKFGSLNEFARITGFDRTTLIKVLSENSKQDISVELFLRYVYAINHNGQTSAGWSHLKTGLGLRSYLAVPYQRVIMAVVQIAAEL